jgi:hypothetical protein
LKLPTESHPFLFFLKPTEATTRTHYQPWKTRHPTQIAWCWEIRCHLVILTFVCITTWESPEGVNGRMALLVSTRRYADICAQLLRQQETLTSPLSTSVSVSEVYWDGDLRPIGPKWDPTSGPYEPPGEYRPPGKEDMYMVSYAAELWPEAKAVWQHTGFRHLVTAGDVLVGTDTRQRY